MVYTVKKLAALAGVSVRTLHFYDEVGLLKPAYRGESGYRFYEEGQALELQQILFYRELGFELKQIKGILERADFDRIAALESHRTVLRHKQAQTRKLIKTIDRTIEHLKGTKKMKSHELFAGFSPEQQGKHEQYLIERFGNGMKDSIAQSKEKVKNWTKAHWADSGRTFDEICRELVVRLNQQQKSDSDGVQAVIRRHYLWLKRFWSPTRQSYAGHSQLIVDSELRKAYEAYHPQLPEFAAAGMKIFAERELA